MDTHRGLAHSRVVWFTRRPTARHGLARRAAHRGGGTSLMSPDDDAPLGAPLGPNTAPKTHTLELETPDGARYDGTITGWQIAWDERSDVTVYFTEDERLIVHDG